MQVRHTSGRPEDNPEAVRPKVRGSISEMSGVRNFSGIYEVAVRYGGIQRRIVGLRRAALQDSTPGYPSQRAVKGRLACVMVEPARRNAPEA